MLLVGAGGLGSPAALYLAAAGVGHLTLRRRRPGRAQQPAAAGAAPATPAIGEPKTAPARRRWRAQPAHEVRRAETRLRATNARTLIDGQHVVLDGSDNFATRYAANEACVALGIPLCPRFRVPLRGPGERVLAGTAGQPGPCYRCLYPEPPPPELAPSCAEAGVLGIVPGIIGLLQATETMKLLLGIGEPLVGRMLHYDALHARFEQFDVPRDPRCPVCAR